MDESTAARPRVRPRVANWDKVCRKRGLRTDADVAHLLRTSQSTITRMKSGEFEPSGKVIAAALWHFGVKFEFLFEVVVTKDNAVTDTVDVMKAAS